MSRSFRKGQGGYSGGDLVRHLGLMLFMNRQGSISTFQQTAWQYGQILAEYQSCSHLSLCHLPSSEVPHRHSRGHSLPLCLKTPVHFSDLSASGTLGARRKSVGKGTGRRLRVRKRGREFSYILHPRIREGEALDLGLELQKGLLGTVSKLQGCSNALNRQAFLSLPSLYSTGGSKEYEKYELIYMKAPSTGLGTQEILNKCYVLLSSLSTTKSPDG